jgi:superfamily II DNA or RNA helicase
MTKMQHRKNSMSQNLKAASRKNCIDNLFKVSGSYLETSENEIDILIVDEAHRLNEKSSMYQNLGEHQVKEIIHSSKLSIFFIDESKK